ncbi:MAG: hypothetical protein ACRD2Y_14375 [Terriglobales bacterium]
MIVDLGGLAESEKRFFALAQERFRAKADWLAFDEFAFGMNSPVYARNGARTVVISNPLYLALEDMWIELGVAQGRIGASGREEGSGSGTRRKETGSRQTALGRDATRTRRLASAHSPARSHR